MGHLVNPISFRLGNSRYWNSRWTSINYIYNYKFLVKSDWNIFIYMMRLLKKNFILKQSFVFSHCVIIRSVLKTFFIIYLWDGKMLQTLNTDTFRFFNLLNKQKILNKFILILFFFLKKNVVLLNEYFFKIVRKIFLSFLLKIYNVILNKYFYQYQINFDNFQFRNIFYFFLILYKNILINKIDSLYKIKTRIYLYFSNLFFFFNKLKENFYFFKYLFTPFFLSFLRTRSNKIIPNLTLILQNFLSNFSVMSGLNYNYHLIISPVSKLDLTSIFIGRYLSIRMRQRYRLMQAIGPVLKDLKRNPLIEGYKIACSGRFTKKEIASYKVFFRGTIPASTVTSFVDYAAVPFILKYSLCCFKVWLKLNLKKMSRYKRFFNIFNDFLTKRTINILKIKKRSILKRVFFSKNKGKFLNHRKLYNVSNKFYFFLLKNILFKKKSAFFLENLKKRLFYSYYSFNSFRKFIVFRNIFKKLNKFHLYKRKIKRKKKSVKSIEII